MTCAHAKLLMADHENLGPAERAILDGHLARCGSCRLEAESLRSLVADLREQIPAPSEPAHGYFEGILPRVHARLERRRERSFPLWALRYAMPVASIAAFFVFGLEILKYESPEASLRQIPADDLSEYLQEQSLLGVSEPDRSAAAEDGSVLKDFLREGDRYTEADPDQEMIDDAVSADDVPELMPILEKQFPTN